MSTDTHVIDMNAESFNEISRKVFPEYQAAVYCQMCFVEISRLLIDLS